MSTEVVAKYYGSTSDRDGKNIYELWEKGIAYGDSITPSGFSSDYAAYLVDTITKNTAQQSRIVSLGSGNGFIESKLADAGYEVLCIDYNEEAVSITSKKGLWSICADFYSLSPRLFHGASLIYADGFFGHLYEDDNGGLKRSANHIKAMHLEPGVKLLVSNDAPLRQGPEVEAHASVPGFWYLSPEYLSAQFGNVGFEELQLKRFNYNRPVSGVRTRSIYLGNCMGSA